MKYSTTDFFNYLYENRCGKQFEKKENSLHNIHNQNKNIDSSRKVIEIGNQVEKVQVEKVQVEKLLQLVDPVNTEKVGSDNKRILLKSILGIDKYEVIKDGLNAPPILISVKEYGTYSVKRYEFELLPKLILPIFILEPTVWNGKSILYNHGHDEYGAKGSFVHYGQDKPYHKWLPLKLINQGYKVIVPEYIGFGEVKKEDHIQEGERGCYINSELLLMYGLNIAGLRVFEAQCILTLMIHQWELKDITVCGTSGGGLITSFLCAIDHRMSKAIVFNYGASFKSSIMAMHHCVDNYIPRVLEVGEVWDILSLIAPVPLLFSTGVNDRIFPYLGAVETIDKLKSILGPFQQECLTVEFFDGGHEIFLGKIFEFLEKG